MVDKSVPLIVEYEFETKGFVTQKMSREEAAALVDYWDDVNKDIANGEYFYPTRCEIMIISAENEDWESVRLFLCDGVDPNSQDETGTTVLHQASCRGSEATVKHVLELGGKCNVADEDGVTPLMLASNLGHLAIVELLIANGADVHMQTTEGWSALHDASYMGRLESFRALLRAGADPLLCLNDTRSVRDLALENNHLEIIAELNQITN